jgi:hypothetical protein
MGCYFPGPRPSGCYFPHSIKRVQKRAYLWAYAAVKAKWDSSRLLHGVEQISEPRRNMFDDHVRQDKPTTE